jgi:hypothetical protein
MQMIFKPKNASDQQLSSCSEAYAAIWAEDKDVILAKFKDITRLKFRQKKITAIIVPGDESLSGGHGVAMELAGDAPTKNIKRAMLIHELSHRLLGGNDIWTEGDSNGDSYFEHRRIYLFMYDLITDLYGETVAKETAARESHDAPYYGKAWNWALNKSRDERQRILLGIIKRKIKGNI